MHTPLVLWTWYLAGALFRLVIKLAMYITEGIRLGKKPSQSIKEWFFTNDVANWTSWGATILVVWCVGTIYIGRLTFAGNWITNVPLEECFAALIGFTMEQVAPAFFKWFAAKITPTV